MRIIINYTLKISFVLFFWGITSCNEDFLEVEPKDQISNDAVWSTTENADLFLNSIYADLPDIFVWRQGTSAEDPEENFSDNSMNGVDWRYSRTTYATSVYTP